MSFDPFGKRRNINGAPLGTVYQPNLTNRGFTSHEHMDNLGLINMNARLYDPETARFLSVDPTLQFPTNAQNYNRYTYVINNPLKYVDPSGYGFFSKLFKGVKKFFKKIGKFLKKWGRVIVVVAITVINPFNSVYLSGFLSGLVASSGNLKHAFVSGITAGLFRGLHEFKTTVNGVFSVGRAVAKTALHGLVGGIRQKLTGGSFKAGFLSAGFTQGLSLSGVLDGFGDVRKFSVRVKNSVAAAVAGGTASVIGGGKFANGAVTAAFSRMFNDMSEATKIRLTRGQRLALGKQIWNDAVKWMKRANDSTYTDRILHYSGNPNMDGGLLRIKWQSDLFNIQVRANMLKVPGVLEKIVSNLVDLSGGVAGLSKSVGWQYYSKATSSIGLVNSYMPIGAYGSINCGSQGCGVAIHEY